MDFNSKYKSSEIEGILDSVGGKQDAIADLDAIRSGAEKGATALQSIPSEYVTETELTAKGYATTSALNNKVDKVSGKQLSTQDFTTELEGKLKGIEANAQKNVQSDWNESDMGSDAYVNNRTHYSYDMEQAASFSIASKNQGDILVTGLQDGAFYRIYNDAGGKNEAFHFVEGRKVVIPSNGPTIEAVCAYEDDYCLKLTTTTYGMTESFVLKEIYVEHLDDVYVSETIARKAEIATINGQSLTEGGDITIQGGGSYDDSEIREAISQLSAITDDFNSDIANLYNVKQDTLVSGTNIKTINGQSLIGSGNIEISGGEGGGTSSDSRKEVIYVDVEIPITSMRPNVIYWIVGLIDVSIESFEESVYGVDTYDVFTAIIESGQFSNNTTSLTLPDYVMWANGVIPEILPGEYELSISRISDGDYTQYFAVLTPFKLVE